MDTHSARILRVDLSKREISSEELGAEATKKYVGGSGLAAKILWDETNKDTEPFSPENPLIFIIGPLTGIVRASSRFVVAGISPLTGIYGEAHSGGDWAYELRRTGFDGIVVTGKADKPAYLWLHNGNVEIRNAEHLWGKDTFEVEALFRNETDKKASVATIGRAGERLVKIACIMNEGKKARAAARCGFGALMGSKNLKAIVVRGTLSAKIVHEERFEESTKRIYASSPPRKKDPEVVQREVESFKSFIRVGGAPIKNWQQGCFDAGYQLADEQYKGKPYFCKACPYSDMDSKLTADGERHMVWEGWSPLGTNCLIDNAEALQTAYSLCNQYGLDSISTGGAISFAMECYDKGLITEKDTGGIKLNWGNHESLVEMVRQIGEREGFGEVLGEGVKRAAENIGGTASEYAMHVKGLELPAHDPRAATSLAVQYSTASIGASHMEAFPYIFLEAYLHRSASDMEKVLRVAKEFGYSERMDRFETKGKGVMTAKAQDFTCMLNSVVVCHFLSNRNILPSDFVELVNCVTGWEMDLEEFMKTGERIFNLKRMFNVRRGISRKDDILPTRILAHKRGEGGAAENLPHLGEMINEHYSHRGWNEEGIPTKEKLFELDLKECLA